MSHEQAADIGHFGEKLARRGEVEAELIGKLALASSQHLRFDRDYAIPALPDITSGAQHGRERAFKWSPAGIAEQP